QRVVEHKNVKEQNRKREEICLSARQGSVADHFRSHKSGRPANTAVGQAINGNIVIIADRDIPIFRIEEDIAKRYIAIAETLRMELQKAVREFEPRGGEHSKGRLYAARHQIDDTLETLFSQQHYVAKPRHTLSRGEFYWPEKFFVRRSFSDERL